MTYYKIILDSTIIGVGTSMNCLRFQEKHSMLLRTVDNRAEYLECNNQLYHAQWMQPIKTNLYSFVIATIVTITEEEYNILKPAIDDEPIPVEEPEEDIPVIEPTDPIEEMTVEFVQTAKINEMSRICRQTIEAGFDLIIRGETKHFSLTTQDQLNLMSISSMTVSQDLIPYHADGEEVMFYTVAEINQIIDGMNQLKNYNIAYYNSLKAYIESLETIEDIAAIEYGTSIPETYKSDVLKILEQ